jgi:hypothetical protein
LRKPERGKAVTEEVRERVDLLGLPSIGAWRLPTRDEGVPE